MDFNPAVEHIGLIVTNILSIESWIIDLYLLLSINHWIAGDWI